jgi:hypothetical protein
MKVGNILKTQLKEIKNFNPKGKALKIYPLWLDSEDRKIDRDIIINYAEIFKNEVIDKNYSENYLKTFYELLCKNDRNYITKRINLNFRNLDNFKKNFEKKISLKFNNKPRNSNRLNTDLSEYEGNNLIPQISNNNKIKNKIMSTDFTHKTCLSSPKISNLLENFKNLTITQKIKLMSNNDQRLKEIIFSTNQECKKFKLDKKNKILLKIKHAKNICKKNQKIIEDNKKNMFLSDKSRNYEVKKMLHYYLLQKHYKDAFNSKIKKITEE